jgi:hypothetical protein
MRTILAAIQFVRVKEIRLTDINGYDGDSNGNLFTDEVWKDTQRIY